MPTITLDLDKLPSAVAEKLEPLNDAQLSELTHTVFSRTSADSLTLPPSDEEAERVRARAVAKN